MIEKLNYTCCFCNEKISPSDIDPMNMSIVGQFDRDNFDKPSQDFYFHFRCLKKKLHDNVTGHFLETNFVLEDS